MAEAQKPAVSALDIPITVEEAGRMFGVSAERIRQLVKAGFIAKEGRNRLAIEAVGNGYRKYRDHLAAQETKTSSDTRVRDARAREIEMRNDERMRKLIPIEDATAALDYLVGHVREKMNSIPARVTRDIELRRKIEAEVNAAQAQIAKALRKSGDVARKGGELPDAGADN